VGGTVVGAAVGVAAGAQAVNIMLAMMTSVKILNQRLCFIVSPSLCF
jgi:hypothetical protein